MKKLISRALVLAMVLSTILAPASVHAATERGSYPTRKGTILVTTDFYKGLIPTGHAAIVYSRNNVIESVSNGVVWGKNNWKSTKREFYGVTLRNTSGNQDAAAADWCRKQIGKRYNFNYFNTGTRQRFYCSQLVWAAFKDKYGINMNTAAFGNAVHPIELVTTNKTCTIYYRKR
ncbi:MAG: hypothetical protein IJJ52_04230 [Lachnospiraceae bacterium]|nr:hypothetical protein [Lachnospiraceae bacterium]